MAKIWLGNLDAKVSEFQVLKLAEHFGKIEKLDFVYGVSADGAKRTPKGYAFVTFESAASAQNAMRSLDGAKLLGRAIRAKPAKDAAKKRPSTSSEASTSKSKAAKLDKIKAMEAKLKAMQKDEDFKLA